MVNNWATLLNYSYLLITIFPYIFYVIPIYIIHIRALTPIYIAPHMILKFFHFNHSMYLFLYHAFSLLAINPNNCEIFLYILHALICNYFKINLNKMFHQDKIIFLFHVSFHLKIILHNLNHPDIFKFLNLAEVHWTIYLNMSYQYRLK